MVEKMGSRIRDLRMLRGLTQEELAFLLYRKKNTISQYESDVFYQKDGGYHDFNAVTEYLYNALPLFFTEG